MRAVITGSPQLVPTEAHWEFLNRLAAQFGVVGVVTSPADYGADAFAKAWALSRNLPVEVVDRTNFVDERTYAEHLAKLANSAIIMGSDCAFIARAIHDTNGTVFRMPSNRSRQRG